MTLRLGRADKLDLELAVALLLLEHVRRNRFHDIRRGAESEIAAGRAIGHHRDGDTRNFSRKSKMFFRSTSARVYGEEEDDDFDRANPPNELRHRVVAVALEEAVGRACLGFRVGLGLG